MTELSSFIIHADTYFKPSTFAREPTEETQDAILHYMEKAYVAVAHYLPDDFQSYESFLTSLRSLDFQSSPGYPYQLDAPTNGEWLGFDGFSFNDHRVARLWHDVQSVFSDEWDTILRVFIKPEPHKLKKAQAGRWRLIMAAPLPVQVAWHMTFDSLNAREIDKALKIPSQQGASLPAGNWKAFYRQWVDKGLTCGLDKSAWDWTVPRWCLDLDLRFRERLLRGATSEWRRIATMLYRHMFYDPILLTSDGHMYQQRIPGIMKSGCVNTISTNSHCQIMIHLAVCLKEGWDLYPFPVACGDDTLQHVKHSVSLLPYEELGVRIKAVSDTMEFVGHTFYPSGPRPAYLLKHLKRLLYLDSDILPEFLDSMARMYVHTEEIHLWELACKRLGIILPLSRQSYQRWYDHVD